MKERTRFQRFVQAALFLAVVLFGVTSLGLVQRSIKLIAGTGASVSASDNTTTGQQEWTISATGSGGTVSDVAAGTSISVTNPTGPMATVSVTPTGVTAATYGDPTHVMSCAMNAEGQATSCSNVAISSGGGTLTNASVTGNGFWTSNTSILDTTANILGGEFSCGTPSGHVWPCSLTASGVTATTYGDPTHVGQCTYNAEGRATSCSNVAITGLGTTVTGGAGVTVTGGPAYTVSASAKQLVGTAVIQTDLTFSSCVVNTWSHLTSASVTANTVTQLVSDSVTWTNQVSGSLSVVSTPTASAAPVFEVTGTQAGDRLVLRLETADVSPNSHQEEGLVAAYAISASSPTWPGGYTFANDTSMLDAVGNGRNSITSVYVASAPSGSNVWVQPAIVNTCTATGQTTQLGGATNLVIEDWR